MSLSSAVPPAFRPLKIVHVGDFLFGTKAVNASGVGAKLSNGFIRMGHQVIDFPYRDVARAGGWFRSRKLGKRHVNRVLKEFVNFSRPDLLVIGHAYMITTETIRAIRRAHPGLIVLQWNVDPLFEPDNVANIKARQDVVDMSFVTTAGPSLRQAVGQSAEIRFLPNPVDLSIERGRNHERENLPFDVFYACGNPSRPKRRICGQDWDMTDFFDRLEERLPQRRFRYAGFRGSDFASGDSYQRVLESASMGLNISRRADFFLYSSDRLAQMIGNGQLILMERSVGYDRLFSDREMGFFSSLDELCALIDRYARDDSERRAVATAGRRRYHEWFNECTVADYMIRATLGILRDDDYPWLGLV